VSLAFQSFPAVDPVQVTASGSADTVPNIDNGRDDHQFTRVSCIGARRTGATRMIISAYQAKINDDHFD
jgi:hypothetical protein